MHLRQRASDRVLAQEGGCRADIPQAHIPRHTQRSMSRSLRAPPSSRCTICSNRCHVQRPWDASHITGVQWLPGMKGDAEKDLKVNQLNNDGKWRKKAEGTKGRQWNMMISLAEPSGSPPTLSAQLCFICQWRVGDAAGGKLSEWELNGTWQNKAMALLCRDSLLHIRSAVGEERPESQWSHVIALCQQRIQRAWWSALKKKKFKKCIYIYIRKNFKFPVQPPDRRDHTLSQASLWYCSKL